MKPPKGKYVWTATVGEKGQIVIPKQARDIFGIKPGATSTVAKGKNGCKLRKMGIFVSNFEKCFVVWDCIL